MPRFKCAGVHGVAQALSKNLSQEFHDVLNFETCGKGTGQFFSG